jgi:hypothetical protein
MEPERRHAKRTTPEQLSCIQFEPERGGRVLNASEADLAFQAASPVRQSSPMRLCVSPNLEQRIELAGKSCGWMRQKTGMDFAPPDREIINSCDLPRHAGQGSRSDASSRVSKRFGAHPNLVLS